MPPCSWKEISASRLAATPLSLSVKQADWERNRSYRPMARPLRNNKLKALRPR
jgi:hypothetical protein